MDCMRACEIISAAHDGELVDATLLAEARAHAQTCPECAAFVRVLDRIGSVPAPGAPAELVARLGRIAEVETAPLPVRTHAAWMPRIATFASAAAVLLVVASIGGVTLLGRSGRTADEVAVRQTGGDEALMAAPTAEMAEDAATTYAGTAAAPQPSYVSLDGDVWALAGMADSAPSAPVSAGSVLSGFDGGPVAERAALYDGADRSTLYVADDRGGYRVFARPVRTLGGVRYGLASGTDVTSFGQWPTLPGSAPEHADGSPVFERAGYDDLGIEVFAAPGRSVTAGFAVAPGTPTDDPAAGNPGWTWWEPLP